LGWDTATPFDERKEKGKAKYARKGLNSSPLPESDGNTENHDKKSQWEHLAGYGHFSDSPAKNPYDNSIADKTGIFKKNFPKSGDRGKRTAKSLGTQASCLREAGWKPANPGAGKMPAFPGGP